MVFFTPACGKAATWLRQTRIGQVLVSMKTDRPLSNFRGRCLTTRCRSKFHHCSFAFGHRRKWPGLPRGDDPLSRGEPQRCAMPEQQPTPTGLRDDPLLYGEAATQSTLDDLWGRAATNSHAMRSRALTVLELNLQTLLTASIRREWVRCRVFC